MKLLYSGAPGRTQTARTQGPGLAWERSPEESGNTAAAPPAPAVQRPLFTPMRPPHATSCGADWYGRRSLAGSPGPSSRRSSSSSIAAPCCKSSLAGRAVGGRSGGSHPAGSRHCSTTAMLASRFTCRAGTGCRAGSALRVPAHRLHPSQPACVAAARCAVPPGVRASAPPRCTHPGGRKPPRQPLAQLVGEGVAVHLQQVVLVPPAHRAGASRGGNVPQAGQPRVGTTCARLGRARACRALLRPC